MLRSTIICLLLIAATAASYGRVLNYDFVGFDDPDYVTENPVVRDGLTGEGVGWALTTGHSANWHPLTWLSHMLDVQLFGLNAAGHHLSSILLHALNALLIFGILQTMTRAAWPSAFVAALFALHPLHVESVAWISERKDVLSTCFGLLCIWAYGIYARRGGTWRYLVTMALLALGLMAKPMLVTLPCVLLLLDFWPLRRVRLRGDDDAEQVSARSTTNKLPVCAAQPLRWILIEKLPLLCLSIASSVATFLVQRGAGATQSHESLTFALRCANAVVSYVRYIGKMFWPADLTLIYPHPNLPGGVPWTAGQIAAAAVILLLITAITIWARRRAYLLVGWLWFLGTLVPVIGIVQVGGQAMADRYTYLPMIGLFIMLAFAAADLVGRWKLPTAAVWSAALAILVACGIGTSIQAHHWRNWRTLYERNLEVAPNAVVVQYNMGRELQKRGEMGLSKRHYEETLRLNPEHVDARNNLALMLMDQGRIDAALEHYRKALEVRRDHAGTHSNLGAAYLTLGQPAKAEVHFRKALASDPQLVPALLNYGALLANAGKIDAAIELYARALRVTPDHPGANMSMGAALMTRKDFAGAIKYLRQALASDARHPGGHLKLAEALAGSGQVDLAIKHFRSAVEITPNDAIAHYRLAAALTGEKQLDEALRHFQEADRLRPDWPPAQHGIARILATHPDDQVRDPQQAIRIAERAAALTERGQPAILDALAAAYASAGRFEEAVATAAAALQLARPGGRFAAEVQARLELYRQNKPYRDTLGKPDSSRP